MIDETGKVTFNEQEQAELDRIIEDRLGRERSKYTDHDEIKGVVEELQAFGYQGTAKEIREAIKTQREEIARQQELEELEQKAKAMGDNTSPQLLQKIEKLENELSQLKGERQAQKQADDQRRQADEAWNKQVKEMTEAYPDIDLDELAEDPKFKRFAKGKGIPLKEVYEDFVEFIGEAEADTIAKVKSKQERSTGSGKGAVPPGKNHGLNKEQMDLVDEWNRKNPRMKMSYQQFADKLNR
ncbi:hypothetical protein [Dehalobacter sp. TeCB1]|uniref:hypothetical protein n=1 Tax=Dehalobacter sp. TeCB1 TaxID=1843715 RepID=UPI00083AF521|nr:hypothetical protein [Dehalobacter sp. TeCB1]OCZ54316.1 hypothetical protein A7D23_05985 [Dehalobacter sp. TeCB1]